jgi:hypothetical protein
MGLYHALLANAWAMLAFGIVAFAVIFIVWSRYTHSLWGKDFWVWLPVLGKMTKWSKMTIGIDNPDTERSRAADATYADRALTTPAERALFSYYADGLKVASPKQFANYREFLILSDQNGRQPMAPFIWIVLAMLTIAEAIGTGLLIAPLLSQDITPNLAVLVGSVIALAIAAIALMITHGAGEDWFRNGLLTRVRKTYDEQSGFFDRQGQRLRDLDPVSPEKEQTIDAGNSSIARLAARIGATTKPAMGNRMLRMVFAVIFIVVFGLGTTFYRHYMFNKEQDAAHSGLDSGAAAAPSYQSMFSGNGSGSASSGNLPMPAAVASAAQQSQQQAQRAILGDSSKANDAGIIILALIYVFTQIIGILTGYKYSFFNGDAENAYHGTQGKMSYADYRSDVLEPVAQRAESRMEQLRSELAKKNPRFRDNVRRFSFIEAITQQLAEPAMMAPAAVRIPQAAAISAAMPAASAPMPDYHALALSILSLDKEERGPALRNAVQSHHLDTEGQSRLLEAINTLKAKQRQPEIDANLLSALGD